MEEVHLWRGTTEQRALRSLRGKLGRFAYFDRQLDCPDWSTKTVLDFGGNEGNLLLDQGCTIWPDRYYCIDVLCEALDEGRKRFPQAHWIHYNHYNCSFNPKGIADLPIPATETDFDIILAYSVFTHTTRQEMRILVEELQGRLALGGVLAFTFIDPHYNSWPETYRGNNLRWRLEKTLETNPNFDVDGTLEQSRSAQWCTLVNGAELHVNNDGVWTNEAQACLTYNVFYSEEALRQEFPRAIIRPPVNGEMQHCCVIQRQK
jgi:hypothetical protein